MIIVALTFAILLACNASAQSYGEEGEDLIPYLNHTISASGYVVHSPAIKGIGGQSFGNLYSTSGDLYGVSVTADNVFMSVSEYYTKATARLTYDFRESTLSSTDEPFEPTVFDISYSPFCIQYGDAFDFVNASTGSTVVRLDGFTLFDAIGASFSWFGAADAYIEGEVVFRVSYVNRLIADDIHNTYMYEPRTCLYSVSFGNQFTSEFVAEGVSLDDMTFRNETDGVALSFNDFHLDIRSKVGTMLADHGEFDLHGLYLDVESCNVRINAVNAPFMGLVQPQAVYVDVAGYDYFNGLFWSPSVGAPPSLSYRQQLRGGYIAVMTSDNLNQRELQNIQFDDSTPISRVPALFLSAVSEFFAIDFFGMGFTLGHMTFVIVLCAVVLIFLKMFAGG